MKRRDWFVVGMLAMVLGFVLAGCTTFQASGLQMGIMINGGTLFNLSSTATEPEVRDAIEKNIKKYGGDAVIDVKIKYGSNPIQWILTAITGGIWMPGTVTVSGTVVKAVN